MKVVLYQPDDGEPPHYPVQLLMLGAALEEAGHEPIIIDGRLGDTPPSDYHMLGVSALTGNQITDALKFCEKSPARVKVWGGWHPTLLPEQTARHPMVDVAVIGQGEETITQLADNNEYKDIDGICWSDNGETHRTPPRAKKKLSQRPRPAWHLVDMKKYISLQPEAFYIASEGCPYNCAYCSISYLKHKWNGLNPGVVRNEHEMFRDSFGATGIWFGDNTFCINKRWTEAVLEQLREVGMPWHCSSRVDIVNRLPDHEILDAKEAGLYKIIFGIESGSDATLKRLNKGVTSREAMEAIKKLHRLGIQTGAHFMFGTPGETRQDVDTTIRFIRRLLLSRKMKMFSVYYYTPYPGTVLHEAAVDEGWEIPNTLQGWGRLGWCEIPDGMDLKDVERVETLKKWLGRRYPGKATYWAGSKMRLIT